MDKPQVSIVTVVSADEGVEVDMELPMNLPASELAKKVLDIMRNMYEGKFAGWTQCGLTCGYRPLKAGETLEEAGVFEGDYLKIFAGKPNV